MLTDCCLLPCFPYIKCFSLVCFTTTKNVGELYVIFKFQLNRCCCTPTTSSTARDFLSSLYSSYCAAGVASADSEKCSGVTLYLCPIVT